MEVLKHLGLKPIVIVRPWGDFTEKLISQPVGRDVVPLVPKK